MYLDDIAEDATLDFKFHTVDTDPAPETLAGSPIVSVYKANGTTPSTAGVTLSVDFASITGLNNVRIDTSADAFYATGNDYQVVLTAGTVAGISVVGYVLANFSIENRSAHQTGDSFARIGAAGVSLSDLGGMSTAMKNEIDAECDEALLNVGLDKLVSSASTLSVDMNDNCILAQLMWSSIVGNYDRTEHSLEAIRVDGDINWISGAGATDTATFSGAAATTMDQLLKMLRAKPGQGT